MVVLETEIEIVHSKTVTKQAQKPVQNVDLQTNKQKNNSETQKQKEFKHDF